MTTRHLGGNAAVADSDSLFFRYCNDLQGGASRRHFGRHFSIDKA
jgi:hypothetical protein